MQEFIKIFLEISPLSIFITIFSGALWGFLFKSFEIDRRTVLIILAFYVPLLFGRILYSLSFSTDRGTGIVGLFFITIYAIAAYLTREFFRQSENRKDKIISDLLSKVDRRNQE